MSVVLRRAGDCFVTRGDGTLSRHSFSFGPHYDPRHTSFGALVACNDERLAPGAGFADHPHRGLDIVSWVLEGQVAHRDSAGHEELVRVGEVQLLRAGSGVVHAETNAGPGPARFAQLWFAAAEPEAAPAYEKHDGRAPVRVSAAITVEVVRLAAGQAGALAAAARVHVLVGRGVVQLDGSGELAAGDSARLTGAGGRLRAVTPTALLVARMEE